MKYACSKCGKAFDHADECKDHEKKCGKDKSFTLSLVMRNEESLSFYWSTDTGIEVDDDGSISYECYQNEDGHDMYILGCRCKNKSELGKAKRALIVAMRKHLREAIKRLGIPEGIKDYAELPNDED
jgi:hypothetical protein